MGLVRVFTSFDFDHDEDLRNLLVGQSKHSDTPFFIADWSVKEHIDEEWKRKVRSRIRSCEVVIVICGEYTQTATGVGIEVKMAQEEGKPYFLLQGRSTKTVYKPTTAKPSDKVYTWTWDNLKKLIHGNR